MDPKEHRWFNQGLGKDDTIDPSDPNWIDSASPEVRRAFVRKVYILLSIQIAFAVALIAIFSLTYVRL